MKNHNLDDMIQITCEEVFGDTAIVNFTLEPEAEEPIKGGIFYHITYSQDTVYSISIFKNPLFLPNCANIMNRNKDFYNEIVTRLKNANCFTLPEIATAIICHKNSVYLSY